MWVVERMEILNKLLADDGTIFVQLNDEELCYCRVLMDEVFGRNNFINMIAVKTKNSSGASGGGEDRKLKKNIEHILCYGKQDFKKFYPSYTTVELSQYLEDMKINGVRLIGDLGLDEAVLIEGTEDSEENNDDSANKLNVNSMSSNIKTALNRHDHT